jgi:ABC-2 type transport system ATP-binding protein
VSSDITWNNMQQTLFAQNATQLGATAGGPRDIGVFKQMWASYFFSVGMATPPNMVNPCGRFSLEWCRAYQEGVTTGQLSEKSEALMFASSPASITDRITAPTLIMAGQADSLFPLSEGSKTFEEIAAAHPATPLKLVWHAAGHDGGVNESERLQGLTMTWFKKYLLRENISTGPVFEATLASGTIVSNNNRNQLKFFTSDIFAGVAGARTYTSRYRGVHQTFPTRRWEAQFRRAGKPTSLGCFSSPWRPAQSAPYSPSCRPLATRRARCICTTSQISARPSAYSPTATTRRHFWPA